jgi:hypothetical protein
MALTNRSIYRCDALGIRTALALRDAAAGWCTQIAPQLTEKINGAHMKFFGPFEQRRLVVE